MTRPAEHPYAGALARTRRLGLAAGALGLVGAGVVLLLSAASFFRGYLMAYLFWTGLSLGCLALLMLHHLVAGGWGLVAQRFLEAGARTIGLMALLFVPLLFGLHDLFEWTHEEVVAASAVLAHKKPYLNVPFFIVRAVVYFVFWIGTASLLGAWSLRQDATRDPAYTVRLRRLAAGGLICHILLMTFATLDWIMSLEPHWFSTIFAWLMVVSQTLTALAFMVLVLRRAAPHPPLDRVVQTKHFHDYGNLILAFVILWTYMMFAQYLIMWSGNIPEDIEWYAHRREGAWGGVAPFLVVFHFALPFVLLLSRRTKRRPRALAAVAGLLLAVHVVYLAWLTLPSFDDLGALAFVSAAASLVGIGGLWLAAFAWLLARRPPLPRWDPRFEDLLASQAHA